jgi:phosphoglycolate phosphatase
MANPAEQPLSLVFDLDGTLIDSAPGIVAALQTAFTSIGRTLSSTDVRSVIGPPVRIMARRLDPTITDEEALAIERLYRTAYDEGAWQNTEAFPTVIQTLHTLSQTATRLFIATNKPRLPTLRILNHLGLETMFEDIVTRDSATPNFTSKPQMLASLIERHSLPAATTIMIGDTAEDAKAAHANHLRFVLMTYGYGHAHQPDYTLDRFSDLLDLFTTESNLAK